MEANISTLGDDILHVLEYPFKQATERLESSLRSLRTQVSQDNTRLGRELRLAVEQVLDDLSHLQEGSQLKLRSALRTYRRKYESQLTEDVDVNSNDSSGIPKPPTEGVPKEKSMIAPEETPEPKLSNYAQRVIEFLSMVSCRQVEEDFLLSLPTSLQGGSLSLQKSLSSLDDATIQGYLRSAYAGMEKYLGEYARPEFNSILQKLL